MPTENKTILLVEDEALIAMMEAKLLKKYGYNIIVAKSGEQAVEIARSGGIDLILMDIELGPGMAGTQAAELILQQRDLPLIFLSSHTERAVVEKTEGITSYGYIVKNSDETVLITSIKMAFRLFDARQKEREREAALCRSEERFYLAMNATQDGIWDRNVVTGEVYYSPAYWKMLGYEAEEIADDSYVWLDLVHPEDRERVLGANRDCVEERCEIVDVDFRMLAKDGEWRWVHSRGSAVARDERGWATRIIGTHTDITQRKQVEQALQISESHLRRAETVAGLGHWELDLKTNTVVGSRNAQLIYGLPDSTFSIEEIQCIPLPKYRPMLDESLRALIEEQSPYRVEFQIQSRADESILDVLSIAEYDPVSQTIFGIIQNITQQKQVEQTLQKVIQEKQYLFRELQHRVKNSLAMIIGMLELTRTFSSNPEVSQALSDASVRVLALAKLYDLLYETASVREIELDKYCIILSDSLAPLRGIRIVRDLDLITIPAEMASPLGSILTELITNAFKYAFPNNRKGTITLSLKKTPNGALLTVQDDGVGLPDGYDVENSSSWGLKLVQIFTTQINGAFRIEQSGGVRCMIEFPIKQSLSTNSRVRGAPGSL